jgi:hypothetical protein
MLIAKKYCIDVVNKYINKVWEIYIKFEIFGFFFF